MKLIINLLVCLYYVTVVDSSRILAFTPLPSKSHQKIIEPLLVELALRGHNITSVTAFPMDNLPDNYRTIRVDDYGKRVIEKNYEFGATWKTIYKFTQSILSPLFGIFFKRFGRSFSEWALQQKEVKELIASDEEFDLIILESVLFQEPFIGLGHRFNAPVIDHLVTGNVLWNYWLLGNPYDTSYIGDAQVYNSHEMKFTQRLYLTVLNAFSNFISYYYGLWQCQSIMDKHLQYPGWESRPPIEDMITNVSLTLINTHHSFNYPYPYSPNFIEIGGLHIDKTKPMPKDFQKLMDEADNGVILFSLGSTVSVSGMIGDQLRRELIRAFSELKQTVLWKWEKDFPDPQPSKNVILGKWFPQQQILGHKNLKLFITHGGLLSIIEAMDYGVPTISIPMYGDHNRNSEFLRYYNCGLTLQFNDMSYESLKRSIHEIFNNPEYAANTKKRSALFHDRPKSALETAVYWTEYVIRHKGANHLRPAASIMPWYQLAMIDVYAAIVLITTLVLYITYQTFKYFVLSVVCRSRQKSNFSIKKNK